MGRPLPPNPDELTARLRKHVDVLAGLIGPRNSGHPSAIDAARVYLTRELESMSLSVTRQSFPLPTRQGENLEVVIAGTEPGLPALIVGSHYDTAAVTPGADDNASAVAIQLELIRELLRRPLRRTVRAAFYDTEEPPHFGTPEMGSGHHAASLHARRERILGMLCLESLGYYPVRASKAVHRPWIIKLAEALFGPRHLVLVSNLRSIPFALRFTLRYLTSGFGPAPTLPAALPDRARIHALSDHRNYWALGYPAVMLTNTAMFRNPHYHEPTDLPATLDYPRMATLTRRLTRTIRRICG